MKFFVGVFCATALCGSGGAALGSDSPLECQVTITLDPAWRSVSDFGMAGAGLRITPESPKGGFKPADEIVGETGRFSADLISSIKVTLPREGNYSLRILPPINWRNVIEVRGSKPQLNIVIPAPWTVAISFVDGTTNAAMDLDSVFCRLPVDLEVGHFHGFTLGFTGALRDETTKQPTWGVRLSSQVVQFEADPVGYSHVEVFLYREPGELTRRHTVVVKRLSTVVAVAISDLKAGSVSEGTFELMAITKKYSGGIDVFEQSIDSKNEARFENIAEGRYSLRFQSKDGNQQVSTDFFVPGNETVRRQLVIR